MRRRPRPQTLYISPFLLIAMAPGARTTQGRACASENRSISAKGCFIREYNDERPKKSLGGLTPTQYAKQLAIRAVTMTEDSKALRY
jgi:transposase InsO family protein